MKILNGISMLISIGTMGLLGTMIAGCRSVEKVVARCEAPDAPMYSEIRASSHGGIGSDSFSLHIIEPRSNEEQVVYLGKLELWNQPLPICTWVSESEIQVSITMLQNSPPPKELKKILKFTNRKILVQVTLLKQRAK